MLTIQAPIIVYGFFETDQSPCMHTCCVIKYPIPVICSPYLIYITLQLVLAPFRLHNEYVTLCMASISVLCRH